MVKSKSQRQTKTRFGRLLQEYRSDRDLTQTDLAKALTVRGFGITASAVNRYESGLRMPSADFIVHVSRCLTLSQEQETALVNACVLDYQARFVTEYLDALKRVGST